MTDPTIQAPIGPPPDAHGTMTVSLAEIDAMGRKAARGAGYAWGMAEEAGRAARWLAAYRLPGPERLSALLDSIAGDPSAYAPTALGDPGDGRQGSLCSLACGVALSDNADRLRNGETLGFSSVLEPMLILPFLCRVARDLAFEISVTLGPITIWATPEGPAWHAKALLDLPAISPVSARATSDAGGEQRRHAPEGYPVPVTVWRALDQFAMKTYVPATAESRLSGAGAGTSDND